jgi:hypothetical protein
VRSRVYIAETLCIGVRAWSTHAALAHEPLRVCACLACGTQDVLVAHADQLVEDPVVDAHLTLLYDTLMQQNLVRTGFPRGAQ